MKRIRFGILLIIILSATSIVAQTAKVISLSSADAVEAKRLYDELSSIHDHWQKFQEHISATYLPKNAIGVCDGFITSSGVESSNCWWFGGFQFDETFHFIVPGGHTATSKFCVSGNTLTTAH